MTVLHAVWPCPSLWPLPISWSADPSKYSLSDRRADNRIHALCWNTNSIAMPTCDVCCVILENCCYMCVDTRLHTLILCTLANI